MFVISRNLTSPATAINVHLPLDKLRLSSAGTSCAHARRLYAFKLNSIAVACNRTLVSSTHATVTHACVLRAASCGRRDAGHAAGAMCTARVLQL